MSVYTQDGVNVEVGDDFSAFAARVSRSTWGCNKFVRIHDYAAHNFRGPRGFHLRGLPEGVSFDLPSDGIGTKVGLITEGDLHLTAGNDLLAMSASDISRWGGLPLAVANVLDVATLGDPGSVTHDKMMTLVGGLGQACRDQGIVLWRGETAELGPYVGSENPEAVTKFNWSSTVFGAYHPRRIIDGRLVRPGHIVVALREKVFRSNGLSSVRKAFAKRFGPQWWSSPEAKPYIRAAAQPSVLYDRFLVNINGWYDKRFEPLVKLKMIAHISGGGIPGKFAEDLLFPRGLSAYLDYLWEPPDIMRRCAQWRGMSADECYRTWNGGQGMLVVLESRDAPRLCQLAKRYTIEAKVCGTITASDKSGPLLTIVSKFGDREELQYRPK